MGRNDADNAKSLLKNTGIFAIGTFGSKLLTLLIIPLCTFYVDPEGMGIYDMTYTVVSLLQPIAMLSVAESLFRWMLDKMLEEKRVLSTWIILFASSMLVFTVVYWAVWAVLHFDDAALLYLLVVSGCVYQSAQFGTRGLHANKLFAVSGIVYSAVCCAITYLLVVILGIGYRGFLLAMLAAALAGACLLVVVQPELRRVSKSLFDGSMAKEMLRYSVFLLPNQLNWWALSWLSRFFIVGFLGFAANGIYSVAMKFPSALSMVANVFFPAWQEQAVSLYGKEDCIGYFSGVFERYARLFLSLLLPAVPFTVLFVRVFMDAPYAQVADLVSVLYLGACFSAFSSFYGVLYLCAKDTGGAASTTFVGAIVSALASIALIPTVGIMGAAIASLAGNLSMWLVRSHQTRRYCPIKVPWLTVVALSFAAVLMGLLSGILLEIWQLLVLAVFGAGAMLLINRDSLGWIKKQVKRKIS